MPLPLVLPASYVTCILDRGELQYHTVFKQVRITGLSLISYFHPLNVFNLINSAAMLLTYPYFVNFFMLTALLNLATACLHLSCGLPARDFQYQFTPMLTKLPMQYLYSFNNATDKVGNSLPFSVFPPFYDLDAYKSRVLRQNF